MQYGICNLSIVPLREAASDRSEMVSQLLFGEVFTILEVKEKWTFIKLAYDNYEAWIDNKQFLEITEEAFVTLANAKNALTGELSQFVQDKDDLLTVLVLGSELPFFKNNKLQIADSTYKFEGSIYDVSLGKANIINTAFLYLNAPYLWGGKTPFGIDCSGFTQMVYKLNGFKLPRDASQQAKLGTTLSFIEESEAGDLAFFDNAEGNITHVGIIMKNHYIIHASGKVRIDRLDQFGIYNPETKKHTHQLRIIKKII